MNIIDLSSKLQKLYPDFEWTTPPDLKLGVLTTNQAFIEAKKQRANPKELAEKLAKEITNRLKNENLQNLEVSTVGPYININLCNDALKDFANSEDATKTRLKKLAKKALVEFFSPNVAKKMHVGHIRSGDLGETLRRILSLKYEKVLSNNYLGDWGVQFSYIIWGIQNLPALDLEFEEIDLEKENADQTIDELYQIYVRVNEIIEADEKTKESCQKKAYLLEMGLQDKLTNEEEKEYQELHSLYRKIVNLSLKDFVDAEKYLNLNQTSHRYSEMRGHGELFDNQSLEILQNKVGAWEINQTHQDYKFDTILGESFYNNSLSEFDFWVEKGLATKEGKAIYVDLEDQKLGRCYLISSQGYSLYTARDAIARFVWAGLFETEAIISIVDNRQSHSFKQLFAILQRVLDSGIYENRSFGILTKEKTKIALEIMKKSMPKHIGFGHMNLPEGAMSTRKGKIFEFEKLKSLLTEQVEKSLEEKNAKDVDDDKIRKITVAALKWADLYRDRDQDIVFDIKEFLKFEGNTGIYQLYTIARINSILRKNPEEKSEIDPALLNEDEKLILKEIFTSSQIIEDICKVHKPHLLCTHLFSLASKVNSWYSKYSVSEEQNPKRKQTLLQFCLVLKEHFWFHLELLGIEPIESL